MRKCIYFIALAAFSLFSTNVMAQKTTKTFVIDAGHGGFDKGSNNGNIIESEYSLELAQKIQKLAKKKNINVILTRDGNDHLDLQSRVNKMHELNPELVISLHLNSASDRGKSGAEVFIKNDNVDTHTEKIGTELAQLVSINSIENRGLKKANFKILKDSKTPTFLIELGFASNLTDAETLKSTHHKNQLAEKIVQFLENYQAI